MSGADTRELHRVLATQLGNGHRRHDGDPGPVEPPWEEAAPSTTQLVNGEPFGRLMAELDARAVDGNEVGTQAPAKIIVPELGITERSTVEIFGPMKSTKTFFVTDLACSMAAAAEWRGHKLDRRRVLYLIGEGTPGLGSRIRAWKYHRGVDDLSSLIFQPTKLTLTSDDHFRALLAWVKVRGPFDFIVLDTLARYSSGADENSSQMQVVIDRSEAIRDASSSDGPLAIVHHSGRGSSDHGRGHTSVESACDLIVRTSIDGNRMAAEVLENRHGPAGAILRYTLEPVPEAREAGEVHDPAVVVPDLAPSSTFVPESRRHLLDALDAIQIGDEWVSSGRWQDAADMPSRTFHRAKKDLALQGYVEVDEASRHPRYRLIRHDPSEQEV